MFELLLPSPKLQAQTLEKFSPRLCEAVSQAPLSSWNLPHTPTQVLDSVFFKQRTPFLMILILSNKLTIIQVFDFQAVHSLKTDCELSYLLATAHATWHHSGSTQLGELLLLVRE